MVKILNKKNNQGCFSAVLGTLCIIIGVIIYAVVSSLVSNLFISLRFGNASECALLSLSFTGIIVAFIAFDIIFIVWQLKLMKRGEEGEAKFNKIFKLTLIICLCVVILFPIISANTFTKLDEASISKVFFIEYRTYDISTDITHATLACNADGNLTYTVTMRDWERVELFGSVNSCGDAFIDEYENLYGYAAYLTKRLSENGQTIRIIGKEYMETHYKDAHPEIWKYIEVMIKESN